MQEEKKSFRKRWALKSADLSMRCKEEAGKKMASHLFASAVYQNALSLFIYISTDLEPDTHSIIEHAWKAGKSVYVPKCLGYGQMEAVKIADWSSLAPGRMGILEPKETMPSANKQDFDLCLVPCVTVTRCGHRLGHGAGYYDRWLKNHGGTRICLCFESLIADCVPQDPWDVQMDGILTETGLCLFSTTQKGGKNQ